MRPTIARGTVGGRPSLTPLAFLIARASFVRWPINRRSNYAKVASMFAIASPLAVDVSTWTSNAITPQPCRCAFAISPAKSSCERESRSSFATTGEE